MRFGLPERSRNNGTDRDFFNWRVSVPGKRIRVLRHVPEANIVRPWKVDAFAKLESVRVGLHKGSCDQTNSTRSSDVILGVNKEAVGIHVLLKGSLVYREIRCQI